MIKITKSDLQDIITNNYYKGVEAILNAITEQQNNQGVLLSSLKAGDMFADSKNNRYIVTKQEEGKTYVICQKLLSDTMKFGKDRKDNNWTKSSIREFLNTEYLKTIEDSFGAENIIEHVTDLISHDGLRDYGKTIDKVSLRTYDDYREQRGILGNYAYDNNRWEWLSTPKSTPSGCGSVYVQVVNSGGGMYCGCSDACGGVRPFFVLKSSIFVFM